VDGTRSRRVVRWLPAVVAAVYLVVVVVKSAGLIDSVYWDTDVSAPFVLAERLRGHGPVFIPHYGSWTVLWALLATRNLPHHAQLWEAVGYPFSVASAVLLGLTTGRVAGRWAGITAAATALVVGPIALRSELTVIYHVIPVFTSAVLAAYLVTLERQWSRPLEVALALLVGLVAGTNAASDPLVWLAAVVPFAVAATVLWVGTRRRQIAVVAGVVLATTIASAFVTNAVMHALGYEVIGLDVHRTALRSLGGSIEHLGRMVALLGGANYALPGGYPHEPLRVLLALLVCAGIGTPFVAVFTLRRPAQARAYAWYWATAVFLLGLTFVATTNARALGAGSANYLLPLTLAAGAGVGLSCAGSRRREIAGALAVAAVGALNIVGIAEGHAGTVKNAIATYEPELVQLLEGKHVLRGYAGYWDAQNLSWQSGMRLVIAPVSLCGHALCGYNFATIRSWYEQRPGPSFLIVDPTTPFMSSPPAFTRDATERHTFGPLQVYLFKTDIAERIHPP
jgi:hypothetical protein